MRQSFKKEERLKSSKVIGQLFASGHSYVQYPFKVNWIPAGKRGKFPARVLISVSKKHFRKASERNHIKRLCREAYRKEKHLLYEFLDSKGMTCHFSMVYIGKSAEEYSCIHQKIFTLLERLISELEVYNHQNSTSS